MGTSDDIRAGGAFVEITGDETPLAGSLKNALVLLGGFGAKAAGIMGAAGAAAAVAFGIALVKVSHAAGEVERGQTRLRGVIKSTGGASGVSAKSVNELATSIMRVTSFDDDELVAAQSTLLRFGNVGKKIFKQATQAAADMSEAMGTDLNSSAQLVGRSLNNPTLGVSVLSRSMGVFDAQQKEVVLNMVKMGNVAGAQAMILDTLNSKFGGEASRQADGYLGVLKRIGVAYGNLKEALGALVLAPMTRFGKLILSGIEGMTRMVEEGAVLRGMISELDKAFGRFGDTLLGKTLNSLNEVIKKTIEANGGITKLIGNKVVAPVSKRVVQAGILGATAVSGLAEASGALPSGSTKAIFGIGMSVGKGMLTGLKNVINAKPEEKQDGSGWQLLFGLADQARAGWADQIANSKSLLSQPAFDPDILDKTKSLPPQIESRGFIGSQSFLEQLGFGNQDVAQEQLNQQKTMVGLLRSINGNTEGAGEAVFAE